MSLEVTKNEPQTKPAEPTKHYTTYPFALRDGDAGGLPSVFLQEAQNPSTSLTILSSDKQAGDWAGATIKAAAPFEGDFGELIKRWFGTGCWQWLHPDAHTSVAADPDALRAMYQEMRSENPGSLEFMLKYCEKYAPSAVSEQAFNSGYAALFKEIEAGSVVNWQDYFFAPSILEHADTLRAKGCHQTFHLHTTLPDSLNRSMWGISLLEAMSKVDTVYVHTETYAVRLEKQLLDLGLPIPEIKRFDLGINSAHISQALQRLNRGNYESEIPGFNTLDSGQKELIHEVVRSEEKIPHRFINLDRIDPGKGTATVLKAVDSFLTEQMRGGKTLAELQSQFRFFFVQQLFDAKDDHPTDIKAQYAKHVRGEFKQLLDKFPGVVFACGAFSGSARIVVPFLMRNMHGITGGTQDGLNLAIMEIAKASQNYDTTVIAGSGSGVAIRAKETGQLDTAFFPTAGSVSAFRAAINDVVKTKQTSPGSLGARKDGFVQNIDKRKDSVITS